MNFSIFSLHAPGPRAFSQTSSSTFPNCRKRKAAAEPVAPAPTIKMRCIASGCQAKDCESLNQYDNIWQLWTTLIPFLQISNKVKRMALLSAYLALGQFCSIHSTPLAYNDHPASIRKSKYLWQAWLVALCCSDVWLYFTDSQGRMHSS